MVASSVGACILICMKNTKLFSALFLGLFLFFGCAHSGTTPERSAQSVRFNKIVSQYTDAQKKLDAYNAFLFDIEEDLPKFGDFLSPEFLKRSKQIEVDAQSTLKSVDASQLTGEDLTTYKLFKSRVDLNVESFNFPWEDLTFNQMDSRLSNYLESANPGLTGFPFDSAKHYRDFIARSEGFAAYVDNQIAVMKKGVRDHVTLNCTVAKMGRRGYQDALKTDVEKNPFWGPISVLPSTLTPQEVKEIKDGFRHMIKDRIIPSYKKFDHFYTTEYVPKCNKGFGILTLPNGKAWYEHFIEDGTTLRLKAEDLHQLGLKEVDKLAQQEAVVFKQLGLSGSNSKIIRKIANDPKYQFASAKAMFDAFVDMKHKVQLVVPQFFSLIPKSDYEIVEAANPESASGSYQDPTEMKPIGRFVVNTKNPHSVSTYEVNPLSLHEAIPGHHFQLALQFEMKDKLSEYRRKVYQSNAYVEGWAHYAEYLGNEMGMYPDPIHKFGYLDDQMLRAVRLVVDTGIHFYGWDQKKAVRYMMDHITGSRRDIEIEVNRYSVWPGQALGYKVGQLKILELRHLAEQELGSKFDIKGFHKAVIGNGTISLPVLEDQVKAWIAEVQAASAISLR
jgi:uncharacterized protein (DUF885 family)